MASACSRMLLRLLLVVIVQANEQLILHDLHGHR